jgi:hypothetical protein
MYIGLQSTIYSRHILLELSFSWQVFEKYNELQISGKSAQWEIVCSTRMDGRKDRPYKANILFFAILWTRLKSASTKNTFVALYLATQYEYATYGHKQEA